MNSQEFKNLTEGKRALFKAFVIILSIFLVVLIVSTTVGILNKIKEGRYIGQEIEAKNIITVSGTGEIYASPDLAIVTFSVITEAETLAEAMSENTEKMNAVIDLAKSQGVEEKDLKTTSFNIYPRYEYYEDRSCISYCPSGKRVLVGYEVWQSLQVKIRDMAKIGQIIEGAIEAGANQAGDLEFAIDKQDELKKQARGQAIEKAKAQASEIASQLRVKLVRITNFSESSIIPYFYGLKETAMGAGGEAPQIEIGENKISVTVHITYETR